LLATRCDPGRFAVRGLRQQLLRLFAMHLREVEVAVLDTVNDFRVIEAAPVLHRSVQIVDADFVLLAVQNG
jgi:hypothetical protein